MVLTFSLMNLQILVSFTSDEYVADVAHSTWVWIFPGLFPSLTFSSHSSFISEISAFLLFLCSWLSPVNLIDLKSYGGGWWGRTDRGGKAGRRRMTQGWAADRRTELIPALHLWEERRKRREDQWGVSVEWEGEEQCGATMNIKYQYHVTQKKTFKTL